MFTKILILLSSGLLASGSPIGLDSYGDARIVGGFEIDITQVPWQTSVEMASAGIQYCGGSIISEKWILTAAHCTQRRKPEELVIRLGTSERLNGGSTFKVKRIVQNEAFNNVNIDYDFSLLELEESIQFNERTQPITLVRKDQVLNDNTMCLVTGFGDTHSSKETSAKLRGVEIPIVNQQKCVDNYKGLLITSRMLCAGDEKGGKDACQRDSGGPLVVFDDVENNAVLIGIVSWGGGCAEPNKPGIYARITEARDWIYQNTGI